MDAPRQWQWGGLRSQGPFFIMSIGRQASRSVWGECRAG